MGYAVALSATAQLATVYVPFLQDAFGTQALTPPSSPSCSCCRPRAFVAVEIEKALRRRGRAALAG